MLDDMSIPITVHRLVDSMDARVPSALPVAHDLGSKAKFKRCVCANGPTTVVLGSTQSFSPRSKTTLPSTSASPSAIRDRDPDNELALRR